MTDDAFHVQLRELLDRNEILQCQHRYARGMDRLDRDLVRSAYHDDAVDDHGGIVAHVDDFIDWAFNYHRDQTRHQHFVTNHTVDVTGDVAHAETYYLFVGTYRDPDAPLTVTGGRYVDRLEKRDGRWAISTRVCLVEWKTKVPSTMSPHFLASLSQVQTVARDDTDMSYLRPLVTHRPPSI